MSNTDIDNPIWRKTDDELCAMTPAELRGHARFLQHALDMAGKQSAANTALARHHIRQADAIVQSVVHAAHAKDASTN